nr:ribonuclease H-like domain-containing protein [Tanacetum cinerariifolium]
YNNDEFVADNLITLISRLDVSNPLHLDHNDSAALTDLVEDLILVKCSVKQFDDLIELLRGTCHVVDDLKKYSQLMKLVQFFMGLDDTYMQIESSILSRETSPDVRIAYATISSEESHIVSSGSNVGTS